MNFFSLFKRNFIYKLKNKIKIKKDNINFKTLDDLFQHYGSDKADFFTKKKSAGHGFSKYYVKHLEELRNKKINILEIGSYAGASAAAFTKYFPYSQIFCFDINISNFNYKSKRIHVYGLDINNKKRVEQTIEKIFIENDFDKFDLIVDDGSHNLSDILISLSQLFKYLEKNGIYVIEDFKYPNYFKYNKNVDDILVNDLIDKLKKKEKFNSNFFSSNVQLDMIKSIQDIYIYKGNLPESDICFIKKN